MSYIHPELVLSPRGKVKNLRVLFDGGQNGWSVAEFEFAGSSTVGVRWNGSSAGNASLGTPQSRGIPTWFVLPAPLHEAVLDAVDRHIMSAEDVRRMDFEAAKAWPDGEAK